MNPKIQNGNKMKKQSNKNFLVANSQKNTYTSVRKNESGNKTIRYIYTEKDLGEGLLDMGVTPTYAIGQPVIFKN